MEFQKLIEERRTIRKYSPEGRITKDELLTIIRAAQEAPKNSQTGRYYCVMSEEMVEKVSRECLPEMNQAKAENASLIITTFVHNRSGFQKDGTPDNELGNGWGCYDLGLQNENFKLQTKIEEIRLVNRAKCCLIQYLKFSEPQAHRYIEKQAMDTRQTRKEVAQRILSTYET